MATTINGIKLKKCNVNGVKCKRINVNSVKVWSGEETFTTSVTSGKTGRDGNYGDWGIIEIKLDAGETFKINNVTFEQRVYTNIDCDLYVNGSEVWNYNATHAPTENVVPVTINSGEKGLYTAASGKTAIMLRIRGWDSSGSWNGDFYNTATITYTTGI